MYKIKFNNKLLTLVLTALMVVAVTMGLCIPKNTLNKVSADTTAPTPLHTYSSKDYDLHLNLDFHKDFTAPSSETMVAKIEYDDIGDLIISFRPNGFSFVGYGTFTGHCLIYEFSTSVYSVKNSFGFVNTSDPYDVRLNMALYLTTARQNLFENFAFYTLKIYDENVAEMFVLTEKPKPISIITLKDGANSLGTLSVATNIKLDTVDFSTIVTKKDGFVFKGWSLTADGAVITDLATVTIDKATTLYAVYEKSSVDILDNIGNSLSKFFSSNFGLTVSSLGGVIILAVLCAIIFKRR